MYKKSLFIAVLSLFLVPLFSHAEITQNLQYGSSGSQVSELQEYLVSKGFLNYQPTGNFYSLTLKAVESYQASVNVPSTGYVGPLTRAAINNDIDAQLSSSTEDEIQETGTTTPATVCGLGDLFNIMTGQPCSQVASSTVAMESALNNIQTEIANLQPVPSQPTGSAGSPTIGSPTILVDICAQNNTQCQSFIQGSTISNNSPLTTLEFLVLNADGTVNSTSTVTVNDNGTTTNLTSILSNSGSFNGHVYTDPVSQQNYTNILHDYLYPFDWSASSHTVTISADNGASTNLTYTLQNGGFSTLTVNLAQNNPPASTAYVNRSFGAQNVPMLSFTASGTNVGGIITEVDVTATANITAPSSLTLYNGDTAIISISTASSTSQLVKFTNISVPVTAGQTLNLSIEGNFSNSTAIGNVASVTLTNVNYQTKVGVTSVASALAGNNQTFAYNN